MKRALSFLRRLFGTSSAQGSPGPQPENSVTNNDLPRLQKGDMTAEEFLQQAKAASLSPSERATIKFALLDAMRPMKERRLSPIRFFSLKNITSVVASFLIIVIAGGGVSYAAESALPGELLYPVKINVNERVRETFARSPEAKARYSAQRAERRLKEAETLAARSSFSVLQRSSLCKDFEAHVQAMEAQIQALAKNQNLKSAHDLSAGFETSLLAHSSLLAMLSPKGTSGAEMLEELTGDIDTAASRNAEAHVAMDLAMAAAPEGTGWDLAELAETLARAHSTSDNLRTTFGDARSSLPAPVSHFVDRKLAVAALALEAADSQKAQTKKSEQLARSALKTMKEAELGMMLHIPKNTETGSDDLQESLQEDVNLVFRHFANTRLRVTNQKIKDVESDLRAVSAATGSTVSESLAEHPLLPIETHVEGAKQLVNTAVQEMEEGNLDEAIEASNMALRHAEAARSAANVLMQSSKEKKEEQKKEEKKERKEKAEASR